MGKRRFSDIVTNVIRVQKSRHIQESSSRHLLATQSSASHHLSEDGVRADVHTMAAGAAEPPLDDLIRTIVAADPFWQPELSLLRSADAQRTEAGPSRSSPFQSKADLSVTLPSPTATKALVQTLASVSPHRTHFGQEASQRSQACSVFFVRSDADSLKDVLNPISLSTSNRPPPTPTALSQMQSFSASPEQVANTSSAAPHISKSNTSFQHSDIANVAPDQSSQPPNSSLSPLSFAPASTVPRPNRTGRPTLTRLNTSEMLRSHTSTALEIGQTPPAAPRKSPTGFKLQLDTSVPRRSATLSSYPHPTRSKQKSLLHPPLPLLTPPTPVRDLFRSEVQNPIFSPEKDFSTVAAADVNDHHVDAPKSDSRLSRSNFTFEDFDFEVSTILPDFLFLGPNVQSEQDVAELKAMGVRRILNVACEIDDLGPLKLRDRFDRYLKLPMLDSVEAKGVQDSIKEACSFLDDARLRSEPVYVHCKAGKSRSVTIVIAYLIHALGWTLQRSYSYVVEKRAAICPNIGFVAELMRYEEKELKLARSTGIYGDPSASTTSPASRPSPHLLPAWGDGRRNEAANDKASTAALATASREAPEPSRGFQERLNADLNNAFGSSQSKSSPDLPSLAFGSK